MLLRGAAYVLFKASCLGVVAVGVIGRQDLSPTVRGLIVAVVSGLLGVAGIVLGSWMSGRTNREILEAATHNRELAEQNARLLKELSSRAVETTEAVDKLLPDSEGESA